MAVITDGGRRLLHSTVHMQPKVYYQYGIIVLVGLTWTCGHLQRLLRVRKNNIKK